MKKITSLALLLAIAVFTFQPAGIIKAQKQSGETIINTATVKFPLSGAVFTETKIFDSGSGTIVGRAAGSNNSRVDTQKLKDEENRLFNEKYGKLTPPVYEAVQKRKGSDMISVGFLIKIPDLPDGRELKNGKFDISEKEVAAISERRNRQVDEAVQKATAPFIEQLARLKRLPETSEKNRSVSPIVSATVTVDELRELVKRNDVALVFLEEEKLGPFLNSSTKTLDVPLVWANGFTGNQVRVAVVEGGKVSFPNALIPSVDGNIFTTPANTFLPLGILDSHASKVAGIINAQTFNASGLAHKGTAFGARIYSANANGYGSFTRLHDAMDAGANQLNTHISNNSWGYVCGNGSMDSFAIHADFIVRFKWDGIVSAVGNSGGSAGCNKANATGLGYNTIAVGSFKDQKTGANLLDDQMSVFSTFGNPVSTYGDREKPDVSAPGENIATTTDLAPWFTANGGSGTSFASPMIAGIHALIQSARPTLANYPEITKSIILASAIHNIEGDGRMSDKDGAGAVDAKVAVDTAVNNRYDWRTLTPSSFPNPAAPGGSPYYEISIGNIPAGQRVKVALNWLSNPTWNYSLYQGTDPLGIDLDMIVVDANGNIVAGSGSWDDSKEVAQFCTSIGGNYKVRVSKYSWNASQNPWTRAAIAWSIT